ncbi:hypothetical protein LEP1GSC073_4117 [Leptospira noguchii str. Cascata]|nr:hypothetical protein LEP1GSC073_4117 [Leptospira noguchii str. Cascata]
MLDASSLDIEEDLKMLRNELSTYNSANQLTIGFVSRGGRFSLCSIFRILSQTFPSLSSSRFDTTGV